MQDSRLTIRDGPLGAQERYGTRRAAAVIASVSPHFSHFSATACGSHALAASGLVLAANSVFSHSPPPKTSAFLATAWLALRLATKSVSNAG